MTFSSHRHERKTLHVTEVQPIKNESTYIIFSIVNGF